MEYLFAQVESYNVPVDDIEVLETKGPRDPTVALSIRNRYVRCAQSWATLVVCLMEVDARTGSCFRSHLQTRLKSVQDELYRVDEAMVAYERKLRHLQHQQRRLEDETAIHLRLNRRIDALEQRTMETMVAIGLEEDALNAAIFDRHALSANAARLQRQLCGP